MFALHHLVCERLPILIYQLECSSNLWSAHALSRLSYSLALHALLFELEVPNQKSASADEHDSGLPRKRLLHICQLLLAHSSPCFSSESLNPYPIAISALSLLDRLVLGSALSNWLSRLHGRSREGRSELLGLKGTARKTTLALPR
jgi:hypothetical protein